MNDGTISAAQYRSESGRPLILSRKPSGRVVTGRMGKESGHNRGPSDGWRGRKIRASIRDSACREGDAGRARDRGPAS